MKNKKLMKIFLLGLMLTGGNSLLASENKDDFFISGLKPHKRPEYAPKIKKALPIDRQQALLGVESPIPRSIENFLRDQGNWFNPFLYPGMSGPYDLRRWHETPAEDKKA